jgi:hypothetical protein
MQPSGEFAATLDSRRPRDPFRTMAVFIYTWTFGIGRILGKECTQPGIAAAVGIETPRESGKSRRVSDTRPALTKRLRLTSLSTRVSGGQAAGDGVSPTHHSRRQQS